MVQCHRLVGVSQRLDAALSRPEDTLIPPWKPAAKQNTAACRFGSEANAGILLHHTGALHANEPRAFAAKPPGLTSLSEALFKRLLSTIEPIKNKALTRTKDVAGLGKKLDCHPGCCGRSAGRSQPHHGHPGHLAPGAELKHNTLITAQNKPATEANPERIQKGSKHLSPGCERFVRRHHHH